jgi:hypothetical protein
MSATWRKTSCSTACCLDPRAQVSTATTDPNPNPNPCSTHAALQSRYTVALVHPFFMTVAPGLQAAHMHTIIQSNSQQHAASRGWQEQRRLAFDYSMGRAAGLQACRVQHTAAGVPCLLIHVCGTMSRAAVQASSMQRL